MTEQRLRTPKEAKRWLREQGLTIKRFAADNGLDVWVCYRVLSSGRQYKCNYGESHRVAVALGIKAGPSTAATGTPAP